MTLRVAIHAGEMDTDDHGLVGTAVNHVFRLTDAPMLKEMLSDSMATLAVIASERVYEDVIRHTPDLINPAEYQPVTVQFKETVAPAWVVCSGRSHRTEAAQVNRCRCGPSPGPSAHSSGGSENSPSCGHSSPDADWSP